MVTKSGEVLKTCSQCSRSNQDYVHFCVYCGAIFGTKLCSTCGSTDSLNGPFCIACGTAITESSNPKEVEGFRWHNSKRVRSLNPWLSSSWGTWAKLAVASGIFIGLAATACLAGHGVSDYFLGRAQWPQSGLVLYTDQPFAGITIKKLGVDNNRGYLVGMLDSSGAIALPGLEEGNYLIKIQQPAKGSLLINVAIDRDRPTIIGFPKKIKVIEPAS